MILTWSTSWQSTALVQDTILPNTYEATIAFEFNTPEREKQLVSFDRMQFLFNGILTGGMVASAANPLVSKLYKDFNTTINTLPLDPLDEAIAAVIMSKLVAITDNNVLIERVDVSSSLGDDICNTVYYDDLPNLEYLYHNCIKDADPSTEPWWHRPGVDMTDIIMFKKNAPEKIIHDSQGWEDYGLGWIQEEIVPEVKGPAKVISMHGWKPKIIRGGKDGTRPMGSPVTD